ncbi:MAG: hypothetical protein ACR2QF_04530 [Geminicoccaceae bacterium]
MRTNAAWFWRRWASEVGAGIMTAAGYAIQMTERTPPSPGESEALSLLVLYAGKPIGSVTMEWHGDLELSFSSSKFFGGKSPGINNAWQLADLVLRAIKAEDDAGITAAIDSFSTDDGEDVIWELTQPPAGGVIT